MLNTLPCATRCAAVRADRPCSADVSSWAGMPWRVSPRDGAPLYGAG